MRSPCALYLCHPPEEIGSLSCRSPKREKQVMYWHSFLCDCTQTETENMKICKNDGLQHVFSLSKIGFPVGMFSISGGVNVVFDLMCELSVVEGPPVAGVDGIMACITVPCRKNSKTRRT